MTEKELRRLNRRELLEMLIMQEKKLERLQKKLDEAEAELSERRIAIKESGSIAEAALKLNGVFTAAQKAAEQYIENIKMLNLVSEKPIDDVITDNSIEFKLSKGKENEKS